MAKLTVADQVVVNTLAYLATYQGHVRDAEADAKMMRAVLTDILPRGNRKNPAMAPIIAAAEDLLAGETACLLTARVALAEFFKWRAGLAYDFYAATAGQS